MVLHPVLLSRRNLYQKTLCMNSGKDWKSSSNRNSSKSKYLAWLRRSLSHKLLEIGRLFCRSVTTRFSLLSCPLPDIYCWLLYDIGKVDLSSNLAMKFLYPHNLITDEILLWESPYSRNFVRDMLPLDKLLDLSSLTEMKWSHQREENAPYSKPPFTYFLLSLFRPLCVSVSDTYFNNKEMGECHWCLLIVGDFLIIFLFSCFVVKLHALNGTNPTKLLSSYHIH